MIDVKRLCMGCMKEKPNTKVCPYCYFSLKDYEVPICHLKPQTILGGKYLIGKAISEDGFGINYIGWDLKLERALVIREYFPKRFAIRDYHTSDYVTIFTEERERLYKEGKEKFLQEVKEFNEFCKKKEIVLVRDYFPKNGTAYIVMEYAVGKTLCEFLGEKGGLYFSAEEIYKAMEPMIKSMSISHKRSEEKKERERREKILEAIFLLILMTVVLLSHKSNVVTADDILSNNITLLDENISVGDTVSFGKNDREWIVLDKKEDKVLLFAKEAVGQRQYHATYEDITWEKCSLRQWLNYDFYNASFSEGERKRICEVVVRNPDNLEYGTEGGNDIENKIFLLSLDEAEKYFEDEMARAIGTSWWLRSPGNNSEFAAEVLSDGSLNSSGFMVSPKSAVRPALWVRLED